MSSSSGAEKYGRWRNAYDSEKCDHNKEDKIVEHIRWKSVPMTNGAGKAGITTARIFTLGISEFWYKGQSYNHDCIEAYIRCTKCGKTCYYTLEFSSSGREMSRGRYERYEPKEGVEKHIPMHMTLKDLYEVYDYKWNLMDNKYSSSKNNCKAYAKEVYYYIQKKYPTIDVGKIMEIGILMCCPFLPHLGGAFNKLNLKK